MARVAGKLAKPNDVPDLAYGEDAAAPGLKFFSCTRQKVILSQRGCATRWAVAQTARGVTEEEMHACRSCPIGAAHAGREYTHYTSYYRASICPRCRRGTMRMIHNRVCVTCRNRELEVISGRNARGNPPVEMMGERAPHRVEFRVRADLVAYRERMKGVDLFEGVLQTMRTTKGELHFGFYAPQPLLRQGRFW